MKAFFFFFSWLFEEILFLHFELLRQIELSSLTMANTVNWIFLLVGFVAMLYWIKQLNLFDKRNEEDKDPSAHSFL